MESDARWAAKWVARVVWNALAGGTLTGTVGALCLGATGALIWELLHRSTASSAIPPGYTMSPEPMSLISSLLLFWGASTGLITGGLVGFIIFGVAAFRAPPGRLFAPLGALIGRVALGQVVATLAALTCFGAIEAFRIQVQGQSLLNVITGSFNDVYLDAISLGAPILMMCGAIAAALTKRDT